MRFLSSVVPMAAMLLWSCHAPVETATRHIVHSGEDALFVAGSRPAVYMATDHRDAHALSRALDEGDQAALQNLIRNGRITEVHGNPPVRVERESFNEREVRIMEGPQTGQRGWVPFEWLKPVPAETPRRGL